MAETETPKKPRILIADDDKPFLDAIAIILRASGFDVNTVTDGNHAILAHEVSLVAKRPFDLLILDLRMPGATGWEVLRHVREHTPADAEPPRVLLTTGFTVELDLDRVKKDDADGILLKPFMMTALVNEVRRILTLHHGEHAARDLPVRSSAPPYRSAS
jgi:DNA-binding response OmpR family regulator